MDNEIIAMIESLRKSNRLPSYDVVFKNMKERYSDVDDDSYKETFDKLVEEGTVVYRQYNDSYYIKPGYRYIKPSYVIKMERFPPKPKPIAPENAGIRNKLLTKATSNEVDDDNLLALIKNSLLSDRVRDHDNMDFLKKEIDFLRAELQYKNVELHHKSDVITCLLHSVISKKPVALKQDDAKQRAALNSIKEVENEKDTVAARHENESSHVNGGEGETVEPNDYLNRISIIKMVEKRHVKGSEHNASTSRKRIIVKRHSSGSNYQEYNEHLPPSSESGRDAIIVHTGRSSIINNVVCNNHSEL